MKQEKYDALPIGSICYHKNTKDWGTLYRKVGDQEWVIHASPDVTGIVGKKAYISNGKGLHVDKTQPQPLPTQPTDPAPNPNWHAGDIVIHHPDDSARIRKSDGRWFDKNGDHASNDWYIEQSLLDGSYYTVILQKGKLVG